jgi:demethylmenaquinone methyltransferase/2-methoxy-6-polyprenyl-1,4-benzoquinol methylase
MFARIAPHYDLMNRLMTGRQDVHWRKEVIQRADLKSSAYVLDIGAGTGDLLCEAKRQQPNARVYAADFTLEMMRIG